VRTLEACEGSKCDKRILRRLVRTVTETGNIYVHLFDPDELAGMAAIKAKQGLALACARTQALREQGADGFCVKKHPAELAQEQCRKLASAARRRGRPAAVARCSQVHHTHTHFL
jgi:hypothetical protein